ncbi:methyltransferase domain-containing protein [candidate division KSB1 bacterium]|nr:methyltransferase domain-containing protein [candidate division KSB1 bacterium]
MNYNAGSIIKAYSKRARLENDSESERSLRVEIPRHFLHNAINAGDIVLDAGGGAGINAAYMAKQCKAVYLMDITPSILNYANKNTKSIDNIHLVRGNIVDLMFPNESFDLAVCLGDPVSYVLDMRFQAFDELIRVIKPRGHLFVGCNSKYGYIQNELSQNNVKEALNIYRTGTTRCVMGPETHLYTVQEVTDILKKRNCRIIRTGSTSSFTLKDDSVSTDEWEALKEMEMTLYGQPEWLGGKHLFFLAQKTEA